MNTKKTNGTARKIRTRNILGVEVALPEGTRVEAIRPLGSPNPVMLIEGWKYGTNTLATVDGFASIDHANTFIEKVNTLEVW